MTLEIGSREFKEGLKDVIIIDYVLSPFKIRVAEKTNIQKDIFDSYYDHVVDSYMTYNIDAEYRKIRIRTIRVVACDSCLYFYTVDDNLCGNVVIMDSDYIVYDKEGVKTFLSFLDSITTPVTEESGVKTCTCGAKHTSTPNYHLDWCDINK